jgi:hypothetical protein
MPEPTYFDPQTGERISELQYRERYGLAAFLPIRHTGHGLAADAPGLPPFGPRCPDCGLAVTTEGALCTLCGAKRAARPVPVFAMVLDPQPEPAYVREAREAAQRSVIAVDDEHYAAGDVLGGSSAGDAQ